MKKRIWLYTIGCLGIAFAGRDTYKLQATAKCSINLDSVGTSCEKDTSTFQLKINGGKWYGTNPDQRKTSLSLVSEDSNLVVLRDPVLYSGTSLIYINKRNGGFIWSQISYSEVLKKDDVTTIYGKYSFSN